MEGDWIGLEYSEEEHFFFDCCTDCGPDVHAYPALLVEPVILVLFKIDEWNTVPYDVVDCDEQ